MACGVGSVVDSRIFGTQAVGLVVTLVLFEVLPTGGTFFALYFINHLHICELWLSLPYKTTPI